eukprot:5907473-Prymnesium_polylepis.1
MRSSSRSAPQKSLRTSPTAAAPRRPCSLDQNSDDCPGQILPIGGWGPRAGVAQENKFKIKRNRVRPYYNNARRGRVTGARRRNPSAHAGHTQTPPPDGSVGMFEHAGGTERYASDMPSDQGVTWVCLHSEVGCGAGGRARFVSRTVYVLCGCALFFYSLCPIGSAPKRTKSLER